MKVALAACCKLENQYINEWVNYHRRFGFDNIILYDNNDENTERLDSVLKREITEGYVIYNDTFYNCGFKQIHIYNDLLEKYGYMYDYICIIDIDEFLVLREYSNIKEFITSNNAFKYVNNIAIFWETYGNNGYIQQTNLLSIIEQFDSNYNLSKDYIYNIYFKSIINCKNCLKNNLLFNDAHNLLNNDNICDTDGNIIHAVNCYIMPNLNHIYIKHFITKSLDEYLEKIKRGLSWGAYDSYDMSIFKNINGWCKEYEIYLNYKLNNTYQNYKIFLVYSNEHNIGVYKNTYIETLSNLAGKDNIKYQYYDNTYGDPKNKKYYQNVFHELKQYINDYDVFVFINKEVYLNPYLLYNFINMIYDKDTCYTDILQNRYFSNTQLNEDFFILSKDHIKFINESDIIKNTENDWWYGSYTISCILDNYENIRYRALGYLSKSTLINNTDMNYKLNAVNISNIIYYNDELDNIFKLHGFIMANKNNFVLKLYNINFHHNNYKEDAYELSNSISYVDKFVKNS